MEPSGGGPRHAAPGEAGQGRGRWAGAAPRPRTGARSGTVPFRAESAPEHRARRDLRAVGDPGRAPEPEVYRPPQEPQPPRAAPPRPPTRAGTWVRGLTGSLAHGLVVLAVFLIGVQIWAGQVGWEGPGIGTISAHVIGGLLAVGLQAFADRRRDRAGGIAVVAVPVVVLGTVWLWWWL